MNLSAFVFQIRKWDRLLLPGALLLALAIRLFNIEGTSLWMDEVYSLMVANTHLTPAVPDSAVHSAAAFYHQHLAWRPLQPDQLLEALKINVHLPLYYLLLNPWLALFGDGAAGLRSFSAVFSTLMLLPVYFLGVAMGGRRLGLLGLLVAACSPFQIYYAQEGRMYAFSLFWTALSTLSFWKILYGERPARWSLPYAISVVAGAASHYMFAFILGFHGLYGLIWLLKNRDWRRLGYLTPALIGLAALATAWRPIYIAQRQGVSEEYHFAKGWVGGMRYITAPLWQPLVTIAGDNRLQRVFYFPLMVVASLIVFLGGKRKFRGVVCPLSFRGEGFLLCWIFIPLFLQIAYDLIMQTHISIIDRYILLISPATCLWLASGLAMVWNVKSADVRDPQTPREQPGESADERATTVDSNVSPSAEMESSPSLYIDQNDADDRYRSMPRWERIFMPSLGVVMVLLAGCAVWPNSPFRDEHNKNRDIQGKIAFMTQNARPGDLVFVNGPWGAPLIAAYYLNGLKPQQPMLYWINRHRGRTLPLPDAARLGAYRRVWLFRYRANNERGLQQAKDYLARLYPHMRRDHDWFIYTRS